MKVFVIFATVVALGQACVLPPTFPLRPELPAPGHKPEVPLPPAGNKPEVPLPPAGNKPELPILPPGISPEVPILPPLPELPLLPPTIHPEVESHVLNFPSDEDPQIRIHVNIKKEQVALTRHARSLLPPTNEPRPPMEWGPNPIVPEHPGWGPNPIPPPPSVLPNPIVPPGNLPEITNPIAPTPEEDSLTFIYPNVQHQLVKLRVQYNAEEDLHKPAPGPSPYKLEWPSIGNKPAPGFPIVDPIFPEVPGKPIIPMPPQPKQPMIELFLDIGEQENY